MARPKKKKEEEIVEVTNELDKLENIVKAGQKNDSAIYTGSKLIRASQLTDGPEECLSTGSIVLDLLLRHPLPVGMTELSGHFGSGKTTIAFQGLLNAQRKNYPTFLVAVERGPLKAQLDRFPEIDRDKLFIFKPRTGEAATQLCIDIFKNVKNAYVILDSVTACQATNAVIAKTMAEHTMGHLAKLMSTFTSTVGPIIDDMKGRLILINQIRANLKSPNGGIKTTGGYGLEHLTSQRISLKDAFTTDGSHKIYKGKKEDGEQIGKRVTFTIVKNRCAPPSQTDNGILIFNEGFSEKWELVYLAQSFGMITNSGSWFQYKRNDGTEVKCQGLNKFMNLMDEDIQLFSEIKTKVIEMSGLDMAIYRMADTDEQVNIDVNKIIENVSEDLSD